MGGDTVRSRLERNPGWLEGGGGAEEWMMPKLQAQDNDLGLEPENTGSHKWVRSDAI